VRAKLQNSRNDSSNPPWWLGQMQGNKYQNSQKIFEKKN
jgi:hypothetical protein